MDKKAYVKERVQKLKNYLITEDEVIKGDADPEVKAEIVEKYRERVGDVLITLDYVMENAEKYKISRNDRDLINDILFCRLA